MTIRIKPEPGAGIGSIAKKAGEEALRAGRPRGAVREEAGRGARALRAPAAATRSRGATQLFTRTRTRSRRPGGSSSRCSTTRGRSQPYEPGTWGPEAASHLLAGHGAWRKPWLPDRNNSRHVLRSRSNPMARGYAAGFCASASGRARRHMAGRASRCHIGRSATRRTAARRRSRRRGRRARRPAPPAGGRRRRGACASRFVDRLHVGLAEADAEAAADDHRLGVEQVDGRGDAGAERLDRAVDQLARRAGRRGRARAPRCRW